MQKFCLVRKNGKIVSFSETKPEYNKLNLIILDISDEEIKKINSGYSSFVENDKLKLIKPNYLEAIEAQSKRSELLSEISGLKNIDDVKKILNKLL